MCLSHLIYSAAVSDSHLPCHAHTILLKATVQHGRRETTCWLTARVRLLPAITRSSTKVIRRIPISDEGGQCETKHRLSWTRKRVVAAHYKKDDRLPSSDISGYHADFHEGHGTLRARQGRGMLWVNRPLVSDSHYFHTTLLTSLADMHWQSCKEEPTWSTTYS